MMAIRVNGKLVAGRKSGGQGSNSKYSFGSGLIVNGNVVSVNTVSDFNGDNTLPITAAAVQAAIGNIETLLQAI